MEVVQGDVILHFLTRILVWRRIELRQLIRFCIVGVIGTLVTACGPHPGYRIYGSSFDCEGTACAVVFDIENRSKDELQLGYEITLSQKHVDKSTETRMVDVGLATGEIQLAPGEQQTVSKKVIVEGLPTDVEVIVTCVTQPTHAA